MFDTAYCDRPVLGQITSGFRAVYHSRDSNVCPGCGKRNWLVGRLMAECAFCETALPLEHVSGFGAAPRFLTPRDDLLDDLEHRPVASGVH